MSFEAMDEEELRSLLIDIGHIEARDMEYDELLATAISLQETSLTGPVPPSSIQTNNNDIRQVHTTFTSSESSTMSSTLMGQADVVDLSNDTEEEVNPVLNQKLQQFVEISGADKTAAKHLLEACGYDLEAALALHLAEAGSHEATANVTAIAASTGVAMDYGHLPDTYFPGMASDAPRDAMLRAMTTGMAGAGNPYLAAARTGNHAARAHRGDAMEEDEFYGYGEEKYSDDEDDEYAEGDSTAKKTKLEAAQYEATHGIRRPDPIRQQRLVDDGPFMRREDPNFLRPSHNGRGSLDPAGVTWMFAPANDISYPGGFEEAKLLARSDKKWLLVNIQSHTEFSSQMLNRDTWTDETVIELIRSHCVFWQRGHLTEDGKQYLQLYRVDPVSELPHIAIIDARTGAKVAALQGYHEPAMFLAFLVEFVDENKVDGMTAPRVRNLKPQSSQQARDYSSSTFGNSSEALDMSTEGDEDAKVGGDSNVDVVTSSASTTQASTLSSSSSSSASSNQNGGDQLKPVSVPATRTVKELYGNPPEEPPANDKTALRISLKPASGGKALVRRYRPTDSVRSLYAIAAGLEADTQTRPFDIARSYPLVSLNDSLDITLVEAGLGGTQVQMRWI